MKMQKTKNASMLIALLLVTMAGSVGEVPMDLDPLDPLMVVQTGIMMGSPMPRSKPQELI